MISQDMLHHLIPSKSLLGNAEEGTTIMQESCQQMQATSECWSLCTRWLNIACIKLHGSAEKRHTLPQVIAPGSCQQIQAYARGE